MQHTFLTCLSASTAWLAWQHWHNREILICRGTKDSCTKCSCGNNTFLTPLVRLTWYKQTQAFYLVWITFMEERVRVFEATLIQCWLRHCSLAYSFILGFLKCVSSLDIACTHGMKDSHADRHKRNLQLVSMYTNPMHHILWPFHKLFFFSFKYYVDSW